MISEQPPTMTLRPYQELATYLIGQHFRNGRKQIMFVLPTGGGKTVCFSDMIGKALRKRSTAKALILTHRVELLTQAGGTLARFGIYPVSLTANVKDKDIDFGGRCMVSMVETYSKRLKKFPQLADYDLIIIDEAHMGNFKKVFRMWKALGKDPYVIGATATPISAKKRDPLYNYYKDIVCPVQIEELIAINSLVRARTFSAEFDRAKLKSDSSNEDGYNEQSQMLQFDKREVYLGLIEKYQRHCLNDDGTAKKTIVFSVNVTHSKAVAESFRNAGYDARHVDGYMDSDERTNLIKSFVSGEFPILCNPNILTAGFDCPPVEVIVVNKATKSVTSWLQMCGRGSRVSPGKGHFIIMDMAENWLDLGEWQDYRDWESIFWKKPPKKKNGSSPAKKCPKCKCINHAAAKFCIDCGYEFPERERNQENPDFVEITGAVDGGLMDKKRVAYIHTLTSPENKTPYSAYDVKTLLDIQAVKGYRIGWVILTINQRSKTVDEFRLDIQELADWKKYNQGWVNLQVERFEQSQWS